MLRSLQPRRTKRTVALAASALAAAGAAAAILTVPRDDDPAPAIVREHTTSPVVRGTLGTTTIVPGKLQFTQMRTLPAGLSGVVTGLPAAGAQIDFGEALYLVNMQPALLLPGTVPMWRPFERGMPDGPDVQQLEAGLQAMGYFAGTVDRSFTELTATAIERMQRALGVSCVAPPRTARRAPSAADSPPSATPDTSAASPPPPATADASPATLGPTCGVLQLGTIVFGAGAVRVAERRTTVGATIEQGSPVLALSSDVKVVRADVRLDDQRLAARGAAAVIVLPAGTRVRGRVARVGAATERRQPSSSTSTIVIPTTIAVENQRRLGRLEHAPVTVHLPGVQRRGVLSVPVEALVALDDTHFAVEVPAAGSATERVPVRTGLFAAGRVEISGRGIRAGVQVVVPEG
ncbi:peptidoglycan-binding protein [Conexibacter woesei]|uniref:Peptidoglycan-binding domain 1 protein n=1 Tax=Conexibacter woesei (strain DSM 14684 / CCUG 47730 / CIP 108061 / JCM 11494 / NBRC 100937 / ID131577) TaxID=469383 RepID=D3F8E7_CONWI|nr:peptidoglycan-binding protein [Conexibacter woesei]ADB49017.1 Peptidoglycan-binding domain 1 protein [Conexibacter woesei DSM 14684]